jgi:hypothetical protein
LAKDGPREKFRHAWETFDGFKEVLGHSTRLFG